VEQADLGTIIMSIIAPIVAFVLFFCGLLAWRLQMIEKRRFEVAEQTIVAFTKSMEALQTIRARHDYYGFDYPRGASRTPQLDYYRAMRKWHYEIPRIKLETLRDAHKDYLATMALAALYLNADVAQTMSVLDQRIAQVKQAANKLARISLYEPKDEAFGETLSPLLELEEEGPPPDWEEEPSQEELLKVEALNTPIRFHSPGLDDPLSKEIATEINNLERACRPYKSLNPWRFIKSYLSMFVPPYGD
jgi:hypothetical protein